MEEARETERPASLVTDRDVWFVQTKAIISSCIGAILAFILDSPFLFFLCQIWYVLLVSTFLGLALVESYTKGLFLVHQHRQRQRRLSPSVRFSSAVCLSMACLYVFVWKGYVDTENPFHTPQLDLMRNRSQNIFLLFQEEVRGFAHLQATGGVPEKIVSHFQERWDHFPLDRLLQNMWELYTVLLVWTCRTVVIAVAQCVEWLFSRARV
mmetsp:Transcript_26561/g.68164  ORF Transcript_26561/g.68164 Transcript_26561/m.68164 type:complete len:210 (-) Transcript_26561:663-1292(-)